MDDVEYDNLVEGIRHRKEAALATLFDLYYEKLYLFAEKYIYDSDRAHDIVQDVFLRIWENAEQLVLRGLFGIIFSLPCATGV